MGMTLNNDSGPKFRSSYKKRPMAEINVTPFVDVMLVLLIVFMVTAPLITQGVQVTLPEVRNNQIQQQKEPVSISIKADGRVFVQDTKLPMDKLSEKLEAIATMKKDNDVLVYADKNVDYGTVSTVMSSLQQAGLVNVGLVTDPPK